MDKLIDAALGIHPLAIEVGAKRIELISGNMANVDTPGYKARDIDFRATLERLQLTDPRDTGLAIASEPLYRVPNHPSLDGNTVDAQLEQSALAEASVRYQASIDFLDARIQGLRKALRGE